MTKATRKAPDSQRHGCVPENSCRLDSDFGRKWFVLDKIHPNNQYKPKKSRYARPCS
jgi:hypothetical protein